MSKKKVSALEKFALKELKKLEDNCGNDEDLEYQQEINNCIIELLHVFANQGHSGFTGPYVINMFMRLAEKKPIGPLTGEADEWEHVYNYEDGTMVEQNLRCPAVFRKDGDNSTANYLYGKVFSEDDGKTWFSNSDSRIPITFPYVVPNQPEYIYLEPVDEDSEDESYEPTDEEVDEILNKINNIARKISDSIQQEENFFDNSVAAKKLN